MHKGKAERGWAAVLLGSNRHPGSRHMYMYMSMYHFGWLAAGTAAARLPVFKALHREAVTEAYDLWIVYSNK
jgi:hypothetical protein